MKYFKLVSTMIVSSSLSILAVSAQNANITPEQKKEWKGKREAKREFFKKLEMKYKDNPKIMADIAAIKADFKTIRTDYKSGVPTGQKSADQQKLKADRATLHDDIKATKS